MREIRPLGTAKPTDSTLSEIAGAFYGAYETGVQISPPSTRYALSSRDAVEIRRRFIALLAETCGNPIGYKIGFTSGAIQAALGVDSPAFGRLFSSFRLDRGRPIDAGKLGDTYAEPEIAFEMARDLAGPVASINKVLDATKCVRPAIEVVGSRVGLANSNVNDMIADNVLASRFLLGERAFDPGQLELDDIPVTIANGHDIYEGNSSDVMGHPARAVMWLVNQLNEEGGRDGVIRAGDVIMSGSCTRFIEARTGMSIRADFGSLGVVELDFV